MVLEFETMQVRVDIGLNEKKKINHRFSSEFQTILYIIPARYIIYSLIIKQKP